MISITSCMDERDIAQEVIMERMVHKGSFLVVEGITDVKRFRNFISSESCSLVSCHSVRRAEGVMRILKARRIVGVIAVLDRDFMSVVGRADIDPNIIRSRYHDLDSDWVHSNAFERYIGEVGDPVKISAVGGPSDILESIHETLYPVSVARLLGTMRIIKCRTSGVDVSRFYCTGSDILPNYCKSLVDLGRIGSTEIDLVEIQVRAEMQKSHDKLQMSNGHDICCAIGKLLQSELGSRKVPQTYGSEIESHIRMCFNEFDFKLTSIYADIREWERKNYPFVVLGFGVA